MIPVVTAQRVTTDARNWDGVSLLGWTTASIVSLGWVKVGEAETQRVGSWETGRDKL